MGRNGITVNAYCPGIVDTHMWVEVDRDLGAINNVGEGESMKAMAQASHWAASPPARTSPPSCPTSPDPIPTT